jgi:mono/diheme cytochrome c family protein
MTSPSLAGCLFALAFCGAGAAAAEPPAPSPADLAARVRAVFAARCTECHGDGLRTPKGDFGYVLDLKRIASNSDLVKPRQPERSPLWRLVRDRKMPQPDARNGPLSDEQIETVRAWIDAGAPSGPAPSADRSPGEPSAPQPFTLQHLLGWIGRMHIPIIHFPIALLIAAALGELWSAWRGGRGPSPAVRFCVLLGAAGAAAAAPLGWLLADFGGQGAPGLLLTLHRWLGVSAAVWAVGLVVLSERDARRGQRGLLFRVAVWGGAVLVGVVGHLGGLLVHGTRFFEW